MQNIPVSQALLRDFYFENLGTCSLLAKAWLTPSTGRVYLQKWRDGGECREVRGRQAQVSL